MIRFAVGIAGRARLRRPPRSARLDGVGRTSLDRHAGRLPAGRRLHPRRFIGARRQRPGLCLPRPGDEIGTVAVAYGGEELVVFERHFAGHRPIHRFKRHAWPSLHQRHRQRPEAIGVVRVVGEEVAEGPAPGVVLPCARGLAAKAGDFRERPLRARVLQVAHDQRIDLHRGVAVAPVVAQFGDALGEPRRAGRAERHVAETMHTLVLNHTVVGTGIEFGAAVGAERRVEAHPFAAADLFDAHRFLQEARRPACEIANDESFDHAARLSPEKLLQETHHPFELVADHRPLAVGDVGQKGEVRRADQPWFVRRRVGERAVLVLEDVVTRGDHGLRGGIFGDERLGHEVARVEPHRLEPGDRCPGFETPEVAALERRAHVVGKWAEHHRLLRERLAGG